MSQEGIIKSISYSQDEILSWIMQLYCPDGFEWDCTYSKGNFYKSGVIPEPKYKTDLHPQLPYVERIDVTDTGFDETFNSIIFDPPFLASKGPSHNVCKQGSNIIPQRFGVLPTMDLLWLFYNKALCSLYYHLNDNGVLCVKSQDTISSAKQYLSHCFIINKAIEVGFYPKDLFVLLAKNRVISSKHKNQQHARKFHSYFMVFIKQKCKVPY